MKIRFPLFILIIAFLIASLAYAINIKDITFKGRDFGKVIFDHNLHIKQEGIKDNCKTCHNAIFNIKKNIRYTMADMEKGLSCGACHNGKRAFDIKDCNKCHKIPDITIKVKETGPVAFSHKKHSGAYKCGSCHPKLYEAGRNKPVGMAQMEKGKSCGACHNGKGTFKIDDCVHCHPTKDVDFKVKDTGDVKFSHDLHAGMYKCGDCHEKLYFPTSKNTRKTMVEMEAAKSCGACHDGKSAFTVKESCDRCHKM
ncbi:MAG TPA: cytochrome c3 family protein [Syntrophales bacterium]|nr:cytochrome c3 family protein [Syntrophales bacterium]